jgi:hypothetical protein
VEIEARIKESHNLGVDQAIAGLAQDGKIVSVRLALFAEMVKGKAWTPAILKEIGGTEGVGVTFLEETFTASTAPPRHRLRSGDVPGRDVHGGATPKQGDAPPTLPLNKNNADRYRGRIDLRSGPGTPDAGVFQYGWAGVIPVTGDWNGYGRTGIGVIDPKTFDWYLRNEPGPGAADAGVFQYGWVGWMPVTGDWNGSGRTGIGVVNPATETWYIRYTATPGAADIAPFSYGAPGWKPVTGSWAG